MGNVATAGTTRKVLTTGVIHARPASASHDCDDCGQPEEACECPDDNCEQGERDEMQRRAERRAQRDDERADAIYAEARGK